MTLRPFAVLLVVLLGLGVQAPQAQEQRIAAVVNDEVISVYDLVTRTRLAVITTGQPDTIDNRQRLQPQVLRTLIDEKIQMQEAARQNVTASDADVEAAVGRIEDGNQMPRGGLEAFIRQAGIDRNVIMTQIKNGVIWQKLVTRKLRSTLQVGDDEVDEQIASLRAAQGTSEFLLAEIFLAVDTPEQEEEVRQSALALADQIQRGAPFRNLARQFSQSASAATGGDIGWVPKGTLEREVDAAIENTPPGQMTPPLRSVGGYYIYAVRQRRAIAGASPDEATVSLSQLLIPTQRGESEADIEAHKRLADTLRESVSGCPDLTRVAKELGVPPPSNPQRLRVAELAPRVREMVGPLKTGEVSAPMRIEQGLLLLMVCTREEAPSNLPSREEVEENMLRQRLDLAARRYLRDLRRAAIVDVRV